MASFIATLLSKVGILQTEASEAVTPEAPEAPAPAEVEGEPESAGAIEAAPAPSPEAPPTRSLTLAELMSEAVDQDAPHREATLARDMGLDVAWKTIFDTAGITTPDHGWTVERSLSFIRKAQSKGMTPVQVRRSLEQALVTDGADIREVARDAVAKDEVLDLYERELENTVGGALEEIATEIRALESKIDNLRQRISDLEEERAGTLRRLTAWKSEKHHLEQQWAKVLQVIAPLV